MSITFTDQLDKPSEITTIPNQLLRPVFGALYGFDVPVSGGGGTPAFTNQYSVSFDGTDDYMSIGTVSELNGSISAVTLSAWFNFSGTYHTDKNLVLSGGSSGSDRFYFQQLSATQLRYGSSSGFVNFTIPTVSASTWYHMAIVHNGTSASAYFNGSPSSSNPQTVTAPTANYGTALKVGAYYTGSAVFGGLLDEVSVFDSALSASNITSIYNSGVPNDISSLSPVGWWRMGDNDGGTGTTITNQGSASSIDGTLTNGPTFSTSVPEYVFNQYSVSFDGSDDFATFTPGIITATTSHTFSLWLNVNAFPTSGIGFALISPMLSCLTLNSDNDIIFETRTGSNYAFGSKEVITNASEDTWYHLVVVKQANTPVGSTTFTYYVDGSSVGTFVLGSVSNTYAFGNSSGSSQLIHLGKYSGGGYFTNILIDEMAIFTSALDSTAISSIYNGGVPGDLSSLNPRNWYRMGDGTEAGSGTTVYDMGASSGTTTDITLTNGPTFSTDVPT